MARSTITQAILLLCVLSSLAFAIRFDGFPRTDRENTIEESKGSKPSGREIIVDNERVWMGEDSTGLVKSACSVLKKVQLMDGDKVTYSNYWAWRHYIPGAIISSKYVVTEQLALFANKNEGIYDQTQLGELAVLTRGKNGKFNMHLVKTVLITNPRYDIIKDENDVALLELQSPIDFEYEEEVAPAIVSCDKADIFSGNTPHHPRRARSTEHDSKLGWGHDSHHMQCIYVSYGMTNETKTPAPPDFHPTYTNVKVYDLKMCREVYKALDYYIDPHNLHKFCTVTVADEKGPDCSFDYNGMTYCNFGHGDHKKRLLVGLMTKIKKKCPASNPNVIVRHAFFAEMFNRAGFECCDLHNPLGCNCIPTYQNIQGIGPYFCPSKE